MNGSASCVLPAGKLGKVESDGKFATNFFISLEIVRNNNNTS